MTASGQHRCELGFDWRLGAVMRGDVASLIHHWAQSTIGPGSMTSHRLQPCRVLHSHTLIDVAASADSCLSIFLFAQKQQNTTRDGRFTSISINPNVEVITKLTMALITFIEARLINYSPCRHCIANISFSTSRQFLGKCGT